MAMTASQVRARTDRAPRRLQGRSPLKAVAPRRGRVRFSRRGRLVVALAALVSVGSLLVIAGAHAYLTQGQVRLARLQQQLDARLVQHRELELRVAQLEQPESVLARAQSQGLSVPANVSDLPQVSTSTTPPPLSSPSTSGASKSTKTPGLSG